MKLRGAMRRLYPVEAIMNLGAFLFFTSPACPSILKQWKG
jgi:hypothetical protein